MCQITCTLLKDWGSTIFNIDFWKISFYSYIKIIHEATYFYKKNFQRVILAFLSLLKWYKDFSPTLFTDGYNFEKNPAKEGLCLCTVCDLKSSWEYPKATEHIFFHDRLKITTCNTCAINKIFQKPGFLKERISLHMRDWLKSQVILLYNLKWCSDFVTALTLKKVAFLETSSLNIKYTHVVSQNSWTKYS